MSGKKGIQETMLSIGFEPNYIRRAFKVYEKNYGYSYNIEVITEIVVRIQHKDKYKMQSYSCFNDEQFFSQLTIGSALEHRYNDGFFYPATVIAKNGSNLKLKYKMHSLNGMMQKNDEIWSDYRKETNKFSKLYFHGSNKPQRLQTLKVGDFVDIQFPLKFNGGWISGRVQQTKYTYVQIAYSTDENHSELTELYWIHKNNESEIAEFTSKCASTLNIPYPQKKERSSKIVFQYVRNCEKIFPYNAYIRKIPLLVSYCILQFYHHSTIYPILKNMNVMEMNTKYKINDTIKYRNNNTCPWMNAIVIDKDDHWITMEFDDKTTKCIHVVKENDMICEQVNNIVDEK